MKKSLLFTTVMCMGWALNSFGQCSVTITTTNVLCNGPCNGAMTATPSGGTAPYTYSWNTGHTSQTITGLCAGVYTVTITDAISCTATASAVISQPPPLTLNTTAMPVCGSNNNGTASTNPSGGTSPYTYNWSNGGSTQTVTGLSVGNYTVTLSDANGCTQSAIVTITAAIPCWDVNGNGINDPAEDINADGFWDALDCISSPTSICAGQSATLCTNGGSFSYYWSTSATTACISVAPTVTTTYTVLIGNGTCQDTANTIVTVNPIPVITLGGNTTICMGQSTTFCASGGTFYLWNTAATTACITVSPTATTTYTVIAVNGTCSDTASITVFVDSLSASLLLVPDTANTANPLLWYGYPTITGTAPFTYYWDFGDGNNSTQPSPSHTYSVSGNYIVCLTVTDANGCISSICDTTYKMSPSGLMQTLIIINPLVTGIESLQNTNGINIYPNPFSSQTVFQSDNPLHNATLTVYNCFGQTVAQIKNINGQTVTFSRDNLASGLYFVRLTTPSPVGEGGGEVIAVDKLVITDR